MDKKEISFFPKFSSKVDIEKKSFPFFEIFIEDRRKKKIFLFSEISIEDKWKKKNFLFSKISSTGKRKKISFEISIEDRRKKNIFLSLVSFFQNNHRSQNLSSLGFIRFGSPKPHEEIESENRWYTGGVTREQLYRASEGRSSLFRGR